MVKEVKEITRDEALPFILEIHYAKRIPSISFAYGLFVDGFLEGIVTYGTPFSSTLRKGIFGPSYEPHIIELNRLCLKNNVKNDASYLVSRSLKKLPKGSLVISFADTQQGHVGYVYQACNFIYCGLSAKRTDWKIKGQEHLHGQTISDRFRGTPNRAKAIREFYGDSFYLQPRSRKHRYVYICGGKKFKKSALENLRYKIEPYPKETKC